MHKSGRRRHKGRNSVFDQKGVKIDFFRPKTIFFGVLKSFPSFWVVALEKYFFHFFDPLAWFPKTRPIYTHFGHFWLVFGPKRGPSGSILGHIRLKHVCHRPIYSFWQLTNRLQTIWIAFGKFHFSQKYAFWVSEIFLSPAGPLFTRGKIIYFLKNFWKFFFDFFSLFMVVDHFPMVFGDKNFSNFFTFFCPLFFQNSPGQKCIRSGNDPGQSQKWKKFSSSWDLKPCGTPLFWGVL